MSWGIFSLNFHEQSKVFRTADSDTTFSIIVVLYCKYKGVLKLQLAFSHTIAII